MLVLETGQTLNRGKSIPELTSGAELFLKMSVTTQKPRAKQNNPLQQRFLNCGPRGQHTRLIKPLFRKQAGIFKMCKQQLYFPECQTAILIALSFSLRGVQRRVKIL
jgi:hypothetical protein